MEKLFFDDFEEQAIKNRSILAFIDEKDDRVYFVSEDKFDKVMIKENMIDGYTLSVAAIQSI